MDEQTKLGALRAPNSAPLPSESDLQRYLSDPNAAQSYRQEAEKRHPRLPEIARERAFIEVLRDNEEIEIKRRFQAKKKMELTRECPADVHTPARFTDLMLSTTFVVGAVLCGLQGTTVLARYISSSGLIPELDGNYSQALLMGCLPLFGGFLFKANADFMTNDEQKALYYKTLTFIGGASWILWIALTSITFAPQPIDTAAITEQLASGHMSGQNAIGTFVSIFVIASGLIAETLTSAVLLAAATRAVSV